VPPSLQIYLANMTPRRILASLPFHFISIILLLKVCHENKTNSKRRRWQGFGFPVSKFRFFGTLATHKFVGCLGGEGLGVDG